MSKIILTVDNMPFVDKLSLMTRFTKAYQDNSGRHTALREAACLKEQYPSRLLGMQEGDVFAGRMPYIPLGFAPQSEGDRFGYYFDKAVIMGYMDTADDDQKELLESLIRFWEHEHCNAKTRASFPKNVAKTLPSDDWQTASGVAFPLYRMAGGEPDYAKLLTLGVSGLKKLLAGKMKEAQDLELFAGMMSALEVFSDCCAFYEQNARSLSTSTQNKAWAEELRKTADALKNITVNRAETFREAIQMVLLYWTIAKLYDFGRMDDYLAEFYVRDIDSGRITEDEALNLLKGMWLLMDSYMHVFDTRIVVGGAGRRNESAADRFCLLALKASEELGEVIPQLTFRFNKKTKPEIMAKAYDMLGKGLTYPLLYNDDVNIPAVCDAFGVPLEDAINYCPYGCGEYVLYKKSFGSPNGVINLLKALEITMHNGIDPVTGKRMGLALGKFEDFESFESFFAAYKKQVEHYLEALAIAEDIEYRTAAEAAPFLFLSILYDDCIERGKGIFGGGVRYLGGSVESYGNTNAADSLTAIKRLVFDEKVISPRRMLEALDADFEGFESERKLLLAAPKYGNDDEEADSMAAAVHEHVCLTAKMQSETTNLHNYLVVVINNHANTILGRKTAASADGRKAFGYMANANNPAGGQDKQGITAMLNSLVKLRTNIHAGSVQNMKFSRDMFGALRPKFEALMKTYFGNGGSQAMISVLSRGDLENAIKEPEKHRNLMVRVGGFSARFVELSPDVQLEILSRTLY